MGFQLNIKLNKAPNIFKNDIYFRIVNDANLNVLKNKIDQKVFAPNAVCYFFCLIPWDEDERDGCSHVHSQPFVLYVISTIVIETKEYRVTGLVFGM